VFSKMRAAAQTYRVDGSSRRRKFKPRWSYGDTGGTGDGLSIDELFSNHAHCGSEACALHVQALRATILVASGGAAPRSEIAGRAGF